MRWLLLLAALGGVALAGLWLVRGSQAFIRQLADYAPASYTSTEKGRARLQEVLTLARPVDWALEDGTIQVAYFVPPRNGTTILFAHGSPGHGIGMFGGEAGRLVERGYGALLIDLPGYGKSEGRRTWDASFVESLRRGIDFATEQDEVDPRRIVAFGYSNGGSVVARAAAVDDRLRAIVLLATYTNLADHLHYAFRRRTPFLGYAAIAAALWSGVPVSELDTLASLREMAPRPTLVVWGGQDRAIPPVMGPTLKSAVPGAEGMEYSRMGHLDFAGRLGSAYIDLLDDFYTRSLGVETHAGGPMTGRQGVDGVWSDTEVGSTGTSD